MINLSFNIYSLLISIALIIAITFGLLLLFSHRKNYKADRFLAILLFIVSFWNASILMLDLEIYRYVEGIFWVPLSYTLALGPCFYFYIRFVSEFKQNQKQKIWPHFIPVVVEIFLFLIEVFQGLPLGIGYYETTIFLIFNPIINLLAILSLMVYGYLARKRIQKYHNWVKNNYSHYHRYNLNWLYRLSSIFLYFLTLWLVYFLVDYFLFDYKLSFYDYYPFHLILAIISIWLSVEAFLKPKFDYTDTKITSKSDSKTVVLADNEIQDKAHWLNQQIEKNLLFLDPELSLKSLAETLGIHPNMVSRIINEGLNKTFSDCINDYRVRSVVNKLQNNQHEKTTFIAIAFDCGFNSKTTFNRVFKKHMGETPLQFRNNLAKT